MVVRVFLLAILATELAFVAAVPATAAVDPDHYLTAGRAVDQDLVFRTLEPAETFELAGAFAAREQWANYLDAIGVLVRQAEAKGDAAWKGRARDELDRFQADMVTFCRKALDEVRQETGAHDPEALNQALLAVELLKAPVLALDLDQRKWVDRAVELQFKWERLFGSLQELEIDQWKARKDEAARVAAQAGQSKGRVCAAADPVEAQQAFERMSALVAGLDGLGRALDDWQWTASSLDYSGLNERTDALLGEAEQLVRGATALADTVMETKTDVALSRVRDFLQRGLDTALVNRNTAALNQALYWHGLAGSILAAHWRGADSGAQWRNGVRTELAGYSRLTGEGKARVRSALQLPDGRPLEEVLQAVLAHRPEGELERTVLARAMVQAWKQDVDQLAVSYGNAQADLAEARDCLNAMSQSGTVPEEPDEPALQDVDGPADTDAGASNATLDAAGVPDDPDDFADVPDYADVNVADDGPQGSPDLEPVDDSAMAAGWGGRTGVDIPTVLTITSTGYHVYAAGSHLGWASGLAAYSVGPADATIVAHLDSAGDHVDAAYENSRAPLLAWKNHASIRADFKQRGDKLLEEAKRPGSEYRKQLAIALKNKMKVLAGAVAIQFIVDRVVSKETCESNYHRLGFHLAYAHQVFMIAGAMQAEGAGEDAVQEATADAGRALREARNSLFRLSEVILASGACADLDDLRDMIGAALSMRDPAAQAVAAGDIWREAEQRIKAMSGGIQGGSAKADQEQGPATATLAGLWGKVDGTGSMDCKRMGASNYYCVLPNDGYSFTVTQDGQGAYTFSQSQRVKNETVVSTVRIEVHGRKATVHISRTGGERDERKVLSFERMF